jgi:hypothetical protein
VLPDNLGPEMPVVMPLFDFNMAAEKEGNGIIGALASITVSPADLGDFVGPSPMPTSVSVSNTGGTTA